MFTKNRTISSMLAGFGSKQQQNVPDPSLRTRPSTPGTSAKDGKFAYDETPYRASNTSLLNMSNPFEKIYGKSKSESPVPPMALEQTEILPQGQLSENLLDRSVKIAFPKKGNAEIISEASLRERVGRFGEVINVGMKEKLAVVLFATSTQALVFCVFHNKVLGDDYKIKYMGTKTMSDEELQEQLRQHQLQQKSPVPPPPTSFLPVKDVSISSYTAPNINTNISTASDLSPLVIPQASNVSASDINDGERTYLQTLSRSGSATASDYDGDYGKLKPDWTNRNQSSSSFTGADLTLKSFNDKSVYRDLDLDESREMISPLKSPILASRKSSFPDHSHRQDGPDNDRHESFKGSRGVGFNDTVTSSQEWARASSKRIELPSPKLVYSSSVEKGEPSQSQFQSQAPSPISQVHSGAQRSPVTKPYTAAQLLKAQEGIKVAESTSGKEGGPGSWKHAKSVVVQRPSYYNINIDQLDRSEGRTSFSNSDTDKSDTRHPIDGDTGVADGHKSNQGQGLGLGRVRRGSTVSLLESRSGDGRGGLDSSVEVKMKWGDMQPDLSPVQDSEASRIGPLSVEKTVPSTPSSSVFVPEMFTPVGREQDQSMVEAMVDRSMGDSDNAAATHPGRLSPMIVIVQKRPSTIISSGKSKPVNYGRRDSSTNTPKRSSAHKNASLRGSPNGLPVGHTKQKDSSSGEGSFMRRNYGEQEEEQEEEEEEVADSGSDLGSRSLRSCSESSSSMDNSSLSHRLLEHQVSRKTDSPAKVEYSPKKRAVRGSKADSSTRSHSEKDRERERDRGREREPDNSSTKDLKDQITVLREKVLLLEAESKLHQDEREDRLTEFKSSEDLWTVQLSALTKRNISLDEENKQLKGLTQSNRIQSTMREAKMSVLEELVVTLRTELTRYQEEALERENEAEAARQAEQLVSGNDSTSRVSDSSFAEGIRNGDKDKGDMSNNQVPTMAPGEGVQTEEPRPVTPLPSTDLRPSTPSLVIISVPNSALVRRTEYPLKVSKSLYEDIASTRRELARYSNTNTTAVPHSSSSSIAGNRRFGDYVDRPVQNYNTAESSESESALLHAIARGDFFESKGPGSTTSTSTGHRSYSDSYRPSSSYSGSSPVPVSRPATRSPPPKQLMSYYSHLLHPSDSRTAISSDSPINRRAGRRREYLARLHEAE